MSEFTNERRQALMRQLAVYRDGQKRKISDGLVDLNFEDIAEAIKGIDMSAPMKRTKISPATKIKRKMDINHLHDETRKSIAVAITRAPLVSEYVRNRVGADDEDFPEHLTKCFRLAYEEYAYNGIKDEDLYDSMTLDLMNRSGATGDKSYAAIAALQAYLFERCEIFKTTPDETDAHRRWEE